MATLATESLDSTEKSAKVLSDQDITALMTGMDGWSQVIVEGVPRVEKVYSFKDFQQALTFTNQVGALAEDVGHHPALLTEWGKVTVTWWSHDLGGVHRNDLIMAARTERLRNG